MLSKNEVKYIQSLRLRKHRNEAGVFVAEGNKLVLEILQALPSAGIAVYALPEFCTLWQQKFPQAAWHPIEQHELEKISQLQSPQQALAIVPQWAEALPAAAGQGWTLVLDGIQDPGNLGTIIRLADWFGMELVVASPDTADVYNPKVVQATMGSLLRVRVAYTPLVSWISQAGLPVYGADMDGENIWQHRPASPALLVIGNEGQGIRQEIRNLLSGTLSIPRLGNAESLNAAMATGILLSHLLKR